MVIFHSYVKLPEGILRSPSPIILNIPPAGVFRLSTQRTCRGPCARCLCSAVSLAGCLPFSPNRQWDFGGTRFSETFYNIYTIYICATIHHQLFGLVSYQSSTLVRGNRHTVSQLDGSLLRSRSLCGIHLLVLFKSGASGGRDGICQENQWKEPRLWLQHVA